MRGIARYRRGRDGDAVRGGYLSRWSTTGWRFWRGGWQRSWCWFWCYLTGVGFGADIGAGVGAISCTGGGFDTGIDAGADAISGAVAGFGAGIGAGGRVTPPLAPLGGARGALRALGARVHGNKARFR